MAPQELVDAQTLSRTSSLSKDAAAAATMQRATYSPVDLAHLLRNKAELEIEDEATRYLDRLDTNGDGLVQAEEMGEFCTQDLDVKLQDAELDALHDLLDNSFDHTRVRDVCAFFESRDAVAGPGPSRLSVPRSNTVTTLAFSPDASRVGCGGIDSVLVVYDLSERVERRLLERRLPNMVGAISSASGASRRAASAAASTSSRTSSRPRRRPGPGEPPHAFSTSPKGCKASSATWELGQNVNAIALNESDGEVAVAAECELTIFSLATKEPKFVFPADGILWAVSMARSIVHVIELDGGASLRVTAKHLRTFFGDPFCVVDFIVVLIDVVLLAGAVGSNLSGAEGFAKAVRLVRLVRLVRVVRAGRIIRKMASSDYRGKLRYDVELPGGDVVRDVDREDVWTEAEDAYARLRDAAPGDGLPTPAKSLRAPRKPLRRISNKTGAPFGERDRMPCTFRVRGIADMRRETLKLMMMGGEAQQAVLWSYDLNATEVAPGTPDVVRSVVEENGTRVVRFARRELTMPFEQTVNGVAISGGGTRVAACDSRGKVVVFDLFERCAVFQEVDGDLLYSCALSHSGDEILFAGASMRVTLCDVNTGATLYGEVADDRVRASLGRGLQGLDRALRPEREAVAAGDYSNGVCVYRADGAILWQKTTWRGRGAPFTWALSWAGDGSRLAIGHWDAYAYVVDANTYRETHHARRGDRVYSVALSSDGGGPRRRRDKRVALYAVAGAGATSATRPAWLLDAFVYAVAASHDDRHVAVGCVNCQVVVFAARAPYARLSTISQEGLVQFIEFSPCAPSLLAVASEQPCVWADVGAAAPRLAPRCGGTSTHGVSLSRHGLAYCSGTLFSTYGTGTNAPSYADRPSYEMAQAALDHDRALGAILCAHPSVVNARGFSGETLLQYAVRKKSAAVVERLLGARCVVGAALGDGNGMNALAVALRNERRTVVRRLLDSIQASAAQFPLGGTATTSALGELAEKYPDILVAFLTDLTMIQDHALAPMGRNIALLPSSTNLITAGSSERSPAKFWDPLLRKSERSERSTGARKKAARVSSIQQTDQAFGMTSPTGKAPAAPERQPTMMRKRWSGISQKALDATRVNLFVTQRSRFSLPGFAQDAHPATSALETPGNEAWRLMIADRADRYREGFAFADLKKTEVAALRAPFESICGTFARGMPEPDSFLAIVARASAQQGVYRAYNSVLVQSIIQFKWDAFAKAIFLSQFALCVLHLSVVCGLYFAVFDHKRDRTTIRNPAGGSPRGVGELLTLVFAALLSLGFLCIELSQILIEGQREYFGGGAHSAWKALDLFCYALQLVVDGVLAFDVGALDVLSVSSPSRASTTSARSRRMIVKIGYEIRHFMIVVSILLLGFWVSFSLLYNQPPTFDQAIDLIDSGLYQTNTVRRTNREIVVIFECFMFAVALLLLNLLIAIMNSAFEQVRQAAFVEVLFEKSRIILNIEKLWLPMVINYAGTDVDFFYPRWLLCLAPIARADLRGDAT
ncbi:hypothetical protein JL722_13363 [Aureococcus anophagefferens]|nr:hypothetical protein JL722_13363 [Aureococcus anophagefferens]